MSVEQLDLVLLVGAAVLLVGIAAVRLSVGTGLPSLVLYVGLGLVLGPEGLGASLPDLQTAQALGYAALVVILAEGGLTTPWASLRPVVAGAASLATVGVLVSVALTAVAAMLLLGVDARFALLVGAVVASTDAAAVFAVLRRVPLPTRVAGLLEAESGFNDATAVILVVALSAPAGTGLPGLLGLAGTAPGLPAVLGLLGLLAYELAVGALVGVLVGRAGGAAVRRIALPSSGLYPLAVMALAVGSYAAAAALHASGFLAVYLAALVLGNARLPHGPAVRGFAEGLGWLAQIGLFVMLGLLVRPSELPGVLLPALGLGGALLLIARPVSVLAALMPLRLAAAARVQWRGRMRVGGLGGGLGRGRGAAGGGGKAAEGGGALAWRELAFLSWAGLRGAVPIVLATVPVVQGVPGGDLVLNLVFVLVIVFALVQAPPLPWVAARLGVRAAGEAREVDLESVPLTHLGADLLELRIPPGSRLHGVEVFELRLPRGAAVPLVVRDGEGFVPSPSTALRSGDEVLVVAPAAVRAETEQRLRAVSRSGRLAGWGDARSSGDPRPRRRS